MVGPKPKLTERQREVLLLRLASFHPSQIAEVLDIHVSTVNGFFESIRRAFKIPFNMHVDSYFMASTLCDEARRMYRTGWFFRIYKKKICKPVLTPFDKYEDRLKNAV